VQANAKIYVYHDKKDSDSAFDIAQTLKQQYQVHPLMPVFDGPRALKLNGHRPRRARRLHAVASIVPTFRRPAVSSA